MGNQRFVVYFFGLSLLGLIGCQRESGWSKSAPPRGPIAGAKIEPKTAEASDSMYFMGGAETARMAPGGALLARSETNAPVSPDQTNTAPNATTGTGATKIDPRKLIYNGSVEIAVKKLDEAIEGMEAALRQSQGFVASSDLSGTTGEKRRGRWTLRVPVTGNQQLLKDLKSLGELIRETTRSQDVTEAYYDLQARLKNKLLEETRLVKHLENSTGKLEEILMVEKEISRVRSEIEQMQGRLNLLNDQTSLATIELTLMEIQTFLPDEAPTFATRISRSFSDSLDRLTGLGEWLVLLGVWWLPWLTLFLGIGVPGVWWLRSRATK